MRIRSLRRPALLFLSVVLAACSDGSGPASPLARLTGVWNLESAVMTEIGGPGVEVFDDFPLRLTFQEDGDYRVHQDGDLVDVGTVAVDGDSLRFVPEAGERFAMGWRIDDDGGLVLSQATEYDFDSAFESWDPVNARLTFRFVRD